MNDSLQNIIIEYRVISETAFFVLLILKLATNIDMSWWIVFSPVLFALFILAILSITYIILRRNEIRREKRTLSESN